MGKREPDETVLTKEQVLARLHVSESALDRLIREGRFPRGVKVGPQSPPLWCWGDVRAWLKIAPQMTPDPEAEKKS